MNLAASPSQPHLQDTNMELLIVALRDQLVQAHRVAERDQKHKMQMICKMREINEINKDLKLECERLKET